MKEYDTVMGIIDVSAVTMKKLSWRDSETIIDVSIDASWRKTSGACVLVDLANGTSTQTFS